MVELSLPAALATVVLTLLSDRGEETLLGGLLVLFTRPQVQIWGIHPGSVLLVGAYVYGLRLASESAEAPMWRAVQTEATQQDIPDEPTSKAKAGPLWWRFAGFAGVLAAAGFALAVGGESLVVAADVAYRPGSVYGAVGDGPLLIASLGLVATSILVLGLLRRERHGVGNIGAESAVVIALYVFALVALWRHDPPGGSRRWTGIEPARGRTAPSSALKAAGPTRCPDTSSHPSPGTPTRVVGVA